MKTKSFDRREPLLEAAMDEFSVKSYDEASLNNIIKSAGISKGTFYYHFRDKQDLYLSLLQRLVDTKMEFMKRRLRDQALEEELNIFEKLKLQAAIAKELAKENPRQYLLGMMFQREKGTPIYETAMHMFGDITETYMDDMMNKALERGDFREGVSLEFIKKTMSFLMYRSDEIIDVRRKNIDIEFVLHEYDELIDFIQFGFGKRE